MTLTPANITALCAATAALLGARIAVAGHAGAAIRYASRTSRFHGPLSQQGRARRQRLTSAVAAVSARWPRRTTCLEEAIALIVLLRAAGIPGRLVVGISRRSGFRAHAWVESEDVVILGGPQSEGMTALVGGPGSAPSPSSIASSCPG